MEKQNDTVYLAMVVYMPETVGNEANYATGAAVPTINLGVNLVANQYTYEEDSFDNQYDSDAYAIVEKDGIEYAYDGEEVILYNVTGNYIRKILKHYNCELPKRRKINKSETFNKGVKRT
mgnify:CR=1 FL=1